MGRNTLTAAVKIRVSSNWNFLKTTNLIASLDSTTIMKAASNSNVEMVIAVVLSPWVVVGSARTARETNSPSIAIERANQQISQTKTRKEEREREERRTKR